MSETSFAGPESPATDWQKLEIRGPSCPWGRRSSTDRTCRFAPTSWRPNISPASWRGSRGRAPARGAGPAQPGADGFPRFPEPGSGNRHRGDQGHRRTAGKPELHPPGHRQFPRGNTVLKPIAKDVNRRDRRLKIILLNGWEYDTSEEGRRLGAGEVHAGPGKPP